MKEVGILLWLSPETGGAYQYVLSMLAALRSLPQSEFRITAYYEDPAWVSWIPAHFVRCCAPRRFVERAVSRVLRTVLSDGIYDRVARRLHPVVREMDRSNCDLVIFPGQERHAYWTRKPAITTIHDLMHRYAPQFEEYSAREFSARETHYRHVAKSAAGILVDSEVGRSHVLESYPQARGDRVFVLPFVPPEYLFPAPSDDVVLAVRERYDLPSEYFFYPAQFWEHKNHGVLLDAADQLRRDGIQANLVFVGGAKNNYHKFVGKVQALDLGAQVRVLGYVPNEHMAALYRGALATVFVSLIGPTNIPPLEAMAVGCPLICSDAFGMAEQVGDGGLLVDARRPEDVAVAMRRLAQDKGLRQRLLDSGLQRSRAWNQAHFSKRVHVILSTVLDAMQARAVPASARERPRMGTHP